MNQTFHINVVVTTDVPEMVNRLQVADWMQENLRGCDLGKVVSISAHEVVNPTKKNEEVKR